MTDNNWEWQGKRRDQVESSQRIFVYSMMVAGSWLVIYGIFKLVKYLYEIII